MFNINPEQELKTAIKNNGTSINFYKINVKKGANGISFTNCIFYDNQNKTLPVGQDLSTRILVDVSKLKLELKKKFSFKIADYEKEKDEFSDVIIKTVNVYEYEG